MPDDERSEAAIDAPATRVCPKPDEPIEVQLMSERFLDIFEARDISVTGVGIFVPYRFEGCQLTSPVDLVITLPKAEPFLAKGRVVHRTKLEREFFGVVFVEIAPLHRSMIARYVARRVAEVLSGDRPEARSPEPEHREGPRGSSRQARIAPEAARMVEEFLRLDRRRFRGGPPLAPEAQERWSELRWRIEEALSGSAARHGTRRRALRVPSNLKVDWAEPASAELGSVQVISERGVFLATEQPLAVGTPVHLRLTGERGESVEVEGAVVWVRQPGSGAGPPGVGIEFGTLDPAQREAVAYLVEEALAALGPSRNPR